MATQQQQQQQRWQQQWQWQQQQQPHNRWQQTMGQMQQQSMRNMLQQPWPEPPPMPAHATMPALRAAAPPMFGSSGKKFSAELGGYVSHPPPGAARPGGRGEAGGSSGGPSVGGHESRVKITHI